MLYLVSNAMREWILKLPLLHATRRTELICEICALLTYHIYIVVEAVNVVRIYS